MDAHAGDENFEECMNLFSQDGVLLKQAHSYYINYINVSGILYINEYLNSNKQRFLEWKLPNNTTIDSDIQDQDQEWAVVTAVKENSSHNGPNVETKSKFIKVNLKEVKSFKVGRKNERLSFLDGKSEIICMFFFQHGNCSTLVSVLKGLLKTVASRRDKHLNIIYNEGDSERMQLDRSFAELDLFQDSRSDYTIWNIAKTFHQHPFESTMEAFAKIADIVTTSPQERPLDESTEEILNRNLIALESSTANTRTQDEYEIVNHSPKLPERNEYPRGNPFSVEQWKNLQDHEGRIEDIEFTKLQIFRGGVAPALRGELWKYLLDYYPWDSTYSERQSIIKQKCDEYYVMKLQWKSMTKIQEENFADYRERKSLIEKDVNRTDRTIDYYAGENNPHIQTLYEILMTYVMYNFDLGYVQGMSDLLSPILYLLDKEVDAFWCFVGFMNKVSSNFDLDQAGMKEQLENLHTLTAFVDPPLATYLDKHDSANMFFCFRWLLVWFKRELSQDDIMILWEVLWTALPCQNFHLLLSVAILETEKDTLMENNYGFTEILKHINDLSGHLDVSSLLNKAEGIYNQIKAASHLTEPVRYILGLPLLTENLFERSPLASSSSVEPFSLESVQFCDTEASYETAISTSFL